MPITDTELKLIAAAAIIGLKQQPEERVEHARRDRHAGGVVDEREEQVLLDVAHRLARQPAGADDAAQVALDERHGRALHGDVGARAHGDADLGLRQRGRVVDAVAGHRHDAPFLLEPLDDFRPSGRAAPRR